MPDKILTDAAVKAALAQSAKDGKNLYLPDSTGRGAGRLALKIKPNGGTWVFRYTLPGGKEDAHIMGRYAKADGEVGLTMRKAREEAAALSDLLRDPATRNIRAYFDARERQAAALQAAQEAEERAQRLARESDGQYTLKALLDEYVVYLKAVKAKSAKSILQCFERNIYIPFPEFAGTPAKLITAHDAVTMIKAVEERGLKREPYAFRSYAAAAYALASGADTSVGKHNTKPAAMIPFGVTHNPFKQVTGAPKTGKRKRHLNDAEFKLFLTAIRAHSSDRARALLIAIYCGGQRPEQILERRMLDWDPVSGILRMVDPKGRGRREEPRTWPLKLAGEAYRLVEEQAQASREFYNKYVPTLGEPQTRYLFAARMRNTNPTYKIGRPSIGTLSGIVKQISDEMLADQQIREAVQMKDLRRKLENVFTRCGIGKETRGQIMSHGIGGVQDKHYVNEEEFMQDTAPALELLGKHLQAIETQTTSNVVAFTRQA